VVGGRLLALLLAALFAGGSGCATDDNPAPSRPTTSTEPQSQSDPGPTRADLVVAKRQRRERSAERTVRSYYREVGLGEYDAAWARLSPGAQAAQGGYDTWKGGYDSTTGTRAVAVTATGVTASRATVTFELHTVDVDACDNETRQTFQGRWMLARESGRWLGTSLSAQRLSGEAPVRDASECGGPPPPSSDDCHPSYEGACLDPNASDYDCEDGEGDGPEYTGPVTVVGEDEYDLDRDGNGEGCESSG